MGILLESGKSSSTNNFEELRLPNTNNKSPRTTSRSTSKQNKKRSTRFVTDSIGHYLSSIGRVPLLTATDEIDLAKKVQTLKLLLKSATENNEISAGLALKSDFNFKEDKFNEVQEIISDEDIEKGVDPEVFKNDLESSIYSGKDRFSKINNQSNNCFARLVSCVATYFKTYKKIDEWRQLKRGLRARD